MRGWEEVQHDVKRIRRGSALHVVDHSCFASRASVNTSTGEITAKPANGTSGIYLLTVTLQDSSLPTNQSTNKQ